MNFLQSLVLGLTQGFAEFFPISSSGHVFLLKYFFNLREGLFLEVWLHLASILAILFFFRNTIYKMIQGLISMVRKKKKNPSGMVAIQIIVASFFSIPSALIMKEIFEFDQFLSVRTVAWTLFITAGLIILAETLGKENRKMNWWFVVLVGIIQGISVLPGLSRAGLTIALLVILGLPKEFAARFSFLLAVPAIFGAFLFSIKELPGLADLLRFEMWLAFAASLLASLLSIKYMLFWVRKHWIWFAPYCIALGAVILFLSSILAHKV